VYVCVCFVFVCVFVDDLVDLSLICSIATPGVVVGDRRQVADEAERIITVVVVEACGDRDDQGLLVIGDVRDEEVVVVARSTSQALVDQLRVFVVVFVVFVFAAFPPI
jgi:hypothetical protein